MEVKMIETRHSEQRSFFGNYVYDKIIPQDNILRKILKIIDFSFVDASCKDLYCHNNGRPGWRPRILFKILFLQFMYDLSDYAIEEALRDRLSFKMFAELEVDETPPDHSTLSRFRDRLGAEKFKEMFNHVVKIARTNGVVSDTLRIVDATDIKAKVDIYRIKHKHSAEDPKDYIDKHSPDKEARPGRKHKGKQFYGYQANCSMDAESEIIVGAHISPGGDTANIRVDNVEDPGGMPEIITADKLYDNRENHEYLSKRNIKNAIITKKNHTEEYIKKYIRETCHSAKRHRSRIEHKFADLKKWHGFREARYWGLDKMRIQTYMATICANVKRMVKILFNGISPPKIRLGSV